MGSPSMAFPPQLVAEWIDLAVKYVEAGGVGCPKCRGGLPSDAAARGHDRHPRDCKGALERRFAALEVKTFLTQPAECWFGLSAAPETLETLDGPA